MAKSKEEQFNHIQAVYQAFERQLLSSGRLPMRSTNTGFWGTSSLPVVFKFFKDIQLEKFRSFLDLGCGDGRMVLLASLFTKAAGVDSDRELVDKSLEICDQLGLMADLGCQDFMALDFSRYDFFFINPDHRVEEAFEDKLMREARGRVLFVYNKVFAPEKLRKGKTYWYDQVPIVRYDILP